MSSEYVSGFFWCLGALSAIGGAIVFMLLIILLINQIRDRLSGYEDE